MLVDLPPVEQQASADATPSPLEQHAVTAPQAVLPTPPARRPNPQRDAHRERARLRRRRVRRAKGRT